EVNTAVALLVGWLVMKVFGERTMDALRASLAASFQTINQPDMTDTALKSFGLQNFILFGRVMLPIGAALLVAGVVVNVVQVGFHVTPKAIRPKLSKLNPLSGLQRLFTVRSLGELVKSLLKLFIVGFLCWKVIDDHLLALMQLSDGDFRLGMAAIGAVAMELVLKVGAAYIVLASADYAFQKWQFEKSIKMTKQEIKEEARSQELAPELKSRIRQVQRNLARRRMMQRVPQADVVITNPTHLAIALQYDASKMAAPKVIAKGQRLIAEQIKEIARAHGVPLVENKPLAQALYRAVGVDQEVPRELYKATAEVLAFIYRLKQQASAQTQLPFGIAS
ncbi:MAG TPA: EscU/YscU/HrcU family type III secretion system export apparatus switch protein, partial [Chloroflexota bacterium]|nr:EscU/YscU/HrcU family type III secretion system export apparatus switch protein [Chloroflexota bacterium]